MQRERQIILDHRFENGFAVKPQTDGNNEIIGYLTCGELRKTPTMVLAQWYCGYWVQNDVKEYSRHNILNGYRRENGMLYEWGDASKILRLNRDTGALELGLNASREYRKDRISGEPWPHILIEYSTEIVSIDKVSSVILYLDFCLEKAACRMSREDEELHTAQFVWYAILKNINPCKRDFGKYIWFGCTLYDSRYEEIPLMADIDGGKEINTGTLIYKPSTCEYLPKLPKVGEIGCIRYDITEDLASAFAEGCRQGMFSDSEFSDMAITGGNIGWEVTGTYDVCMRIDRLELNVREKKEG